MDDLLLDDAVGIRGRLGVGDVSARELLEVHLRQIERLDPTLHAFVTVDAEAARDTADRIDRAWVRGDDVGELAGLPIGIKDIHPTRGLRTTYGSLLHQDDVPEVDALVVERLRSAGGVIIGKTNTPEFAAGSQTYNRIVGATLNPYDHSRTCGGSSGGSAVAVATGMVALADGSDLGGSLRNPASFCNVVGFRPSPGRVPRWPSADAWDSLAVQGPIAHSVRDVALMMSVLAGPDPRSPIGLQDPGSMFLKPLKSDLAGARVAVSVDLGGYPVDRDVREVVARAGEVMEREPGAVVEHATPDLRDADAIFTTLRAARFAASYAHLLDDERRQVLNDDVIWNIEEGLALDPLAVLRAERERTELYHRVRSFFEAYDYLLAPTSQVPPFPANERYPSSIEGHEMPTYISWMATCYAITVTSLPAISVPGGFSPTGLPIGVQLVSGPRADFELLGAAAAFEAATSHGLRRPTESGETLP